MFKLERIRNVVNALSGRKRHYDRRFESASRKVGMAVIQRSLHFVPIDTGPQGHKARGLQNLAESAFVNVRAAGFGTQLVCGYGAPYSVYVHEDLTKRHGADYNSFYADEIARGVEGPRRPQEKAKFLGDVIDEGINQGTWTTIINVEMRDKNVVSGLFTTVLGEMEAPEIPIFEIQFPNLRYPVVF